MKVEGGGRHVVLKRLAANLSGKSRGRQSTSLACLYGPRGL
jgi:hypothetical protein